MAEKPGEPERSKAKAMVGRLGRGERQLESRSLKGL
jgi:hypothetical protein